MHARTDPMFILFDTYRWMQAITFHLDVENETVLYDVVPVLVELAQPHSYFSLEGGRVSIVELDGDAFNPFTDDGHTSPSTEFVCIVPHHCS